MAVRKAKSAPANPSSTPAQSRAKPASRAGSLRPSTSKSGPATPSKTKANEVPKRRTKKVTPKKAPTPSVWLAPSEEAKLRYGILIFLLTLTCAAFLTGELHVSRDNLRFGNKVFNWSSFR